MWNLFLSHEKLKNWSGKTMTLQEADDYCTINAQKYLHWALEDEKVGMFQLTFLRFFLRQLISVNLVAFLPFYWKTLPPNFENSNLKYPNHYDLSMLTNCAKTWEGIGRLVKSSP